MDVSTAIATRMSCRAFLPTPLPKEILVAILDAAKRAPSGGNLQPWLVHVVTGEPLAQFIASIRDKLPVQPMGEGAEYHVYPPDLHEPYRSRRFKCGEDLYATLGIPRTEKQLRIAQFARNYAFFGAPVAMFISIDRRMGADQWSDVGMFMQNVMLLARERGLHTCAQEAWTVWHKTVGAFLRLPAEHMLFCGLAIGYRDEDAAVNTLVTERAPLEEFATLIGFE
jgi:nitroreductase